MARRLWFAMMWLMRRPVIKRARRGFPLLLPKSFQQRAWESVKRQDRLARRYGLPILIGMMTLLLGSIFVTAAFMGTLKLYEQGALTGPVR
ncbi:MAG: hypothetical protein H6534_08265 [Chthonomonadaceae bacterium]|nr:hypothetical protein [Chthonomonadaceae bacterium]